MDDKEDSDHIMDEHEIEHFQKIIKSFLYYQEYTFNWIQAMERAFSDIPDKHRLLIPNLKEKFEALKIRATKNYEFVKAIVKESPLFENVDMQSYFGLSTGNSELPHPSDMEKVKTTIRQFVRDWSDEGIDERNQCYSPLLKKLCELYPAESNRSNIHILCPGSGLGRLAFEIARLGFTCQGNEFSYFMLLASNFILNKQLKRNELTIYPFVHQSSNVVTDADQLRGVAIPDIDVELQGSVENNFSMAAGDFVEIYHTPSQREQWDSIVTCFFVDTAMNVIQYVEVISYILKPGGYWINLGPLLYHYAEIGHASVELSYQQLRSVMQGLGFSILVSSSMLPLIFGSQKK